MIARSTELHHHEQDVLRADSMAHYFDYSSVAGTTYIALKHPIRHVLCLLLLSILWLPTIIADATPTSSPRYTAPTAPHGPTDPDEVKAFVDAFFTDQMQERHIPGAVFVLVKDGTLMLAQGYGYANLEQLTPIVPETTVFRVQSISKLFTATALMQLHERGQLDLHADVNTYLRHFQLASAFARPVTTAQLLTHTAGFDQVATGVSARTTAEQQPLGDYLAHSMPARMMPPGVIYSYNNHGMSLAGYLIEEISGQPFAQYMTDNILQPLDMRHSRFVRLPDLAPQMATEYTYRAGTYQPVPFDYLNTLPAGGLNATGSDMAHFMIAHLQNGRYLDRRILSEVTTQEMHQQHFTAHPQLPGVAYGFHEYFQNGLRALEHGGTWAGSTSELMLFPAQNMGFFMSYTRNDEGLRDRFTKQFIDHYFPAPEAPTPSVLSSVSPAHNAQFVGSLTTVQKMRAKS
jgi:CubicO group peptidase (beta-lactamase class C family)